MKAWKISLGAAGGVLALLFGFGFPTPAAAQVAAPADTLEVEGRTVTLALDEDGRLLIDGRPARLDRQPLVLKFDPDDRVVVFGPDRMVRRRLHVGPPAPELERDLEKVYEDLFEVYEDLGPGLEALGERLEVEIGPPLREAFEEAHLLRRQLETRNWEGQAEIVRLERETHRLAREARQAEGAERRRLERELREQLDDLFDHKLELRGERIERLSEEIEAQREQLRERRARRDEIVDRRLRELLGEDDLLDW